jgi:hypothetical protein
VHENSRGRLAAADLEMTPQWRDFPAMEVEIRDEVARLGVMDIAGNILAEP